MSRSSASLRLALAIGLSFAAPAFAAPGYTITKIAVEGEPAPGTAEDFGSFLFISVTLSENGEVVFAAPLSAGPLSAGVYVASGGGPVLRMRDGDPAPPPLAGDYAIFGFAIRMDGSGRLIAPVVATGGTGGVAGLFRDDAGVDSTLVSQGEVSPAPPGGTLDVAIFDVGFPGVNPSGDIAFRSGVTSGSATDGIFVRASGGGVTTRALQGELVDGGPDAFDAFDPPSINTSGTVAFGARLAGGTFSRGLFTNASGVNTTLALDGQSAPGSGGSTFVDFLHAAINPSGQVVFLSNLVGGSAIGGVYSASPSLTPLALQHQVVPGAGPIEVFFNLPDVTSDGRVPMSLAFSSGPVVAGVYVRTPAAVFDPVTLAGEAAPDTGGAGFDAFGFADMNEAGQVAFGATLNDGRSGIFLATPTPASVPLLPTAALPALALLLLGSASLQRSRRSRR